MRRATPAPDHSGPITDPFRRRLTMALVMAAVTVVILDTTIANVALSHIQASLQATPESVSWVLTSYILASAIALPLTGWLSDRIGRRTLFVVALTGFTLSSMLCGVATSLPMMVAARIAQGLFGAFLSPMSQAIMYDINPPEKHVQAMLIWGLVIMVSPIAGPILGGWITDNFSWRWVFYINVPIGVVTAIGAWLLLSDVRRPGRSFDALGFVLLALALASMQLLLDRGQQLDWFDSVEVCIEAGVMVGAAWMFVIHTLTAPQPLLPRALFADRNFISAMVAITVLGGILMAGAALVAPMLQRLLDYPVMTAGLATAPRGAGTMVGMLTAGRLMKRVDARALMFVGMALLATSLWMMSGFSLAMDRTPVMTSGFVQGIGFGLTIMPMNLLAMTTLVPALRTDGASLYNLMRSIGGSIAISAMTALIARNVQVNHAELGSNITDVKVPIATAGILERLGVQGSAALQMIDLEINRRSLMIAYIDDYWAMMWAAIAVLPLIAMMKRAKAGAPPAAADAGH